MTAPEAAASTELRELYRELILDHARHPRHFGTLESATHSADGVNPLCGDRLQLHLRVAGGDVAEASFEGTGCAISMASASLLTETVPGMRAGDAAAFGRRVIRRLRDGLDEPADTDDRLRALEGVREFPSRVKCATLAWHALDAALAGSGTTATTE